MIASDTLRALTRPAPGNLEAVADRRLLEAAGEDRLLRDLVLWEGFFRAALRAAAADEALASLLRRSLFLGCGIIDWPGDIPDGPSAADFPRVGGYRLGLAAYVPLMLAGPAAVDHTSLWTGRTGIDGPAEIPFAVLPAAFTPAAHPTGGRAAAVARDAAGQTVLLTAGHVLGRRRPGARMALRCASCAGGCHGVVAARAGGYIDAAILAVGQAGCLGPPPGPGALAVPLTGGAVRHHFGSTSGAVTATVMQGLAPPAAMINPVAPRTFLTDAAGHNGDSGSAISDDPPWPGAPALAGIHCGLTDILLRPGNIVQRSYAQDADEALRLFACTLTQGLYR